MSARTLADLDLTALLTQLLTERVDLVNRWLCDQPGSWGALAGQAIVATRRALGRPLNDDERRVVWQATWDLLLAVRARQRE